MTKRRRAAARTHDEYGSSDLRSFTLIAAAALAAVLPVVFYAPALVPFAVPKALMLQAGATILAGLLIALLLQFRATRRVSRIDLAAGGVFVAYVAATIAADDWGVALLGAPDRGLGLITVAGLLVFYFAVSTTVRSDRDTTTFQVISLAGSGLVLGYAIVQWLGKDPIPWASGQTRPFSTLGNPDALGVYLGTQSVIAAALAWSLRRAQPRLASLAILLGLLLTVGAVLSGTRAVAVGYAAVAAATGIWWARRFGLRRTAVVVFGAALAVGTVLFATASLTGIARPLDRISESGPLENVSVSGRLTLYRIALQQVVGSPILGVGPDGFTAAFPAHRTGDAWATLGSSSAIETSVHSWPLRILTDAGVLGGAAVLALIVIALRRVTASPAGPQIVALGGAAFFLGASSVSISDVGTEWLLWASLGIVAGLDRARSLSPTPGRGAGPSGRSVLLGRAAAALACIVALGALMPLQAAEAAGIARRARAAGNAGAAVLAAETATRLDRWRAEYWHGLGLSFAAARNLEAAERAFERAAQLAPYHTTYLANLARAQVAMLATSGRRDDAAVRTAERAVRQDPNSPEGHSALALALFGTGRGRDAIASAETARALRAPVDPLIAEQTARQYLAMDRPADAERWARSGVPSSSDRPMQIRLRMILARALMAMSRHAETVAELEVVLSLEPGHPEARALLERVPK